MNKAQETVVYASSLQTETSVRTHLASTATWANALFALSRTLLVNAIL